MKSTYILSLLLISTILITGCSQDPDKPDKNYPFAGTYVGRTTGTQVHNYRYYEVDKISHIEIIDSAYRVVEYYDYIDSVIVKPIKNGEKNSYTVNWTSVSKAGWSAYGVYLGNPKTVHKLSAGASSAEWIGSDPYGTDGKGSVSINFKLGSGSLVARLSRTRPIISMDGHEFVGNFSLNVSLSAVK